MFILGLLPRTALRLSWAIIGPSLRDSGVEVTFGFFCKAPDRKKGDVHFGFVTQDCASLVLGYYRAVPPGLRCGSDVWLFLEGTQQEKGRCSFWACYPGLRFACPGLLSGRPSGTPVWK